MHHLPCILKQFLLRDCTSHIHKQYSSACYLLIDSVQVSHSRNMSKRMAMMTYAQRYQLHAWRGGREEGRGGGKRGGKRDESRRREGEREGGERLT